MLNAGKFYNHLSNIAQVLINKIPPTTRRPLEYLTNNAFWREYFDLCDVNLNLNNMLNEFSFIEVSYNVRSAITSMKNSKSTDNLNSKIVKTFANPIIHPLTKLINICILEGVLSEVLKISKVIPISKSGNNNKVSDYRPIFFYFTKLLEILLNCWKINYYTTSNVLI